MKLLGLCFLIYDKINHEELWYNWIKNVDQNKYKIYIHHKYNDKLKYFDHYKLRNCIKTKYEDISLVKAQNLLLKECVKDNCTHCIFLSGACIPLKIFDHIYDFLDTRYSYFNKADDRECFPICNETLKHLEMYEIKKASQWSIINNKHASILVNSDDYLKWFDYPKQVPDEHCYITKLIKSKLYSEIKTTPHLPTEATTFTNWNGMNYKFQNKNNPHNGLKNYEFILSQELDYLLEEPCLFGRKFNKGCYVLKIEYIGMIDGEPQFKREKIDLLEYLLNKFRKEQTETNFYLSFLESTNASNVKIS